MSKVSALKYITLPSLFLLCGASQAVTLVDFQPAGAPTQPGYTAATSLNSVIDGITFSFTAENLFDRIPGAADAGTFTYADLYNDYAYTNSGAPMTLAISGLVSDSRYDIRFFSSDRFDSAGWANVLTNTFTPTTGTGAPISIEFDRTVDPLSNLQNSGMGTFVTSASGTLVFDITTIGDGGTPFTRVNGLEISQTAVPVPAAVWLFGGGLLGLVAVARRRVTL